MNEYTDKLKSRLIRVASSMTHGRHLQNIQGLYETQRTLSTRKLALIVEEIEERQRLDAVFLKSVFDYIIKLEDKK